MDSQARVDETMIVASCPKLGMLKTSFCSLLLKAGMIHLIRTIAVPRKSWIGPLMNLMRLLTASYFALPVFSVDELTSWMHWPRKPGIAHWAHPQTGVRTSGKMDPIILRKSAYETVSVSDAKIAAGYIEIAQHNIPGGGSAATASDVRTGCWGADDAMLPFDE